MTTYARFLVTVARCVIGLVAKSKYGFRSTPIEYEYNEVADHEWVDDEGEERHGSHDAGAKSQRHGPHDAGASARPRFIISFCGSGTGHMTQALTLMRLLQERHGYELTGVVTDTDAGEGMLDANVKPLGVPLLVMPAVKLLTKDGVAPAHETVISSYTTAVALSDPATE